MFAFRFLAAFGSATDAWAMSTVLLPLPVGGQTLLLAGAAARGQYHLLDSTAQGSVLRASYPLSSTLGAFMLTDAALLSVAGTWQLWSVSHTGNQILRQSIGTGGGSVFEVSLQNLGPVVRGGTAAERLVGTAGDDLIFGGGGADTLTGGAGDDLLIATGPGTRFEGGAGADVFRIGAGGGMSSIADFQPGFDRIDLGDWGRIYDISALTIRARSFGAELSYGDQILRVSQPGGGRIDPASWSADDFLFSLAASRAGSQPQRAGMQGQRNAGLSPNPQTRVKPL